MASRGGCLGPHADGDRSGADADSTISTGPGRSSSCSARSVTISASRRRPRSSMDGSDRSITSRPASRPQPPCSTGSTSTRIDGYDVRQAGPRHRRSPSEARHVPAIDDAGVATAPSGVSPRRWTSSCSPAWQNPTASGAPGISTARRWTGSSSARETLGVQHAPPDPIVKGRHLLALGLTPGPRVGAVLRQIYEKQLDGSIAIDRGRHGARARDPRRAILIRYADGMHPSAKLPLISLSSCRITFALATPGRRAGDPTRRPAHRPLRRRTCGSSSRSSSRTRSVASSIGVATENLPTRGFGLVAGAHWYPLRLGFMTLGTRGRVQQGPPGTRP